MWRFVQYLMPWLVLVPKSVIHPKCDAQAILLILPAQRRDSHICTSIFAIAFSKILSSVLFTVSTVLFALCTQYSSIMKNVARTQFWKALVKCKKGHGKNKSRPHVMNDFSNWKRPSWIIPLHAGIFRPLFIALMLLLARNLKSSVKQSN